MAVTAEQLKVEISSSGAGKAASNIAGVGRAARDTAGDVAEMGSELGEAAAAATGVAVPARAAASSIDTLGEESAETGTQAAAAAGGVGALAGATSGLRISLLGLSGSITAVAGAVGALTLALAPVLPALAAAAGALTGLAGGIGLVVGSGIIAWGEGFKTALQDTVTEIQRMVSEFGQNFVPLIKTGVRLLPQLVRNILDAAGNMDPFVQAVRDLGSAAMRILPRLVGLFMDVARQAMPAMRRFGGFLADNLVPALRALFDAGMRAAGPVARVGTVIYDAFKSLAGVAGWVGRFVVALWDLAAAAGGVGKNVGQAFGRVTQIIRQGIGGAISWIRSSGIPMAKKALSLLAKKAVQGFNVLKRRLPPLIRQGINAALNWIKTTGVTLAKKAVNKLWTSVKSAFNWLKTDGLSLVKQGLRAVWTWVKGSGKTAAKKAFRKLWNGMTKVFDWLKTDGKTAVKKGAKKVWKWIKGPGKTKAKNAFKKIWQAVGKTFNWLKTDGKKLVKKGFKRIAKWIRGPGKQLLKTAFASLMQFKTGTLGWRKMIRKRVKQAVKGAVRWVTTKGVSSFLNAFYNLGNNLGPALVGILNFIPKAFKKAVPKARKYLRNNGMKVIKGAFGALGKAVRLLLLGMFAIGGMIGGAVVKGLQGIADWLRDGGLKKLEDAFRNIVSGIASYLKNKAAGDLKGAAEMLFDIIMTAAKSFAKELIGNSLIKDMVGDIASYFRNDAASDLKTAASKMFDSVISAAKSFAGDLKSEVKTAAKNAGNALINKFNSVIPSSVPMPSTTIDAGSVMGRDLGQITIGGGSIGLPQLDTGGFIESDGLAMLHEGERVLKPAKVDRDGGGSGGTTIRKIEVHANSRTEGREAARGLTDELRSRNLNG